MIRFIIRRLLGAAVVVWIVSVVTFAIFQLAPTLTHQSPVYYYIAKQPPPQGSAQFKELEHAFGFDRPLFQQYWNWLSNIFHPHTISNGTGETTTCHVPCLGYSFKLHTPVSTLIWQALPVSLSLAVGA
jgi:peptide/nickel transport system permease protein